MYDSQHCRNGFANYSLVVLNTGHHPDWELLQLCQCPTNPHYLCSRPGSSFEQTYLRVDPYFDLV